MHKLDANNETFGGPQGSSFFEQSADFARVNANLLHSGHGQILSVRTDVDNGPFDTIGSGVDQLLDACENRRSSRSFMPDPSTQTFSLFFSGPRYGQQDASSPYIWEIRRFSAGGGRVMAVHAEPETGRLDAYTAFYGTQLSRTRVESLPIDEDMAAQALSKLLGHNAVQTVVADKRREKNQAITTFEAYKLTPTYDYVAPVWNKETRQIENGTVHQTRILDQTSEAFLEEIRKRQERLEELGFTAISSLLPITSADRIRLSAV